MRLFSRPVPGPVPGPSIVEAGSDVRFADVAGIDDVVDELRDIVEQLGDPDRFAALGATPPRGVLLHGDPGCGKTLLGRAVAGEVGVPFYFASATSFVERYVGLGASRVRELFDTARAEGAGVVFLDELDAVGRRRGDAAGDREFDHTLNQLLVEMDGFTGAPGTVVIAATNRPELLDPALVRPGRLDRRVEVPRPDGPGREAVLRLHARRRPGAADLDWARVAQETEGHSAAELAGLVNEAALLAVRRGAAAVAERDVTEALDRLTRGSALARPLSDAERRRLAWHEAGHATVAAHLEHASLPPRLRLAGHGAVSPWSRSRLRPVSTEAELAAELVVLLAGRAAERELAGGASTLAEDDLVAATALAERMSGLGMTVEGAAGDLLGWAGRQAEQLVRRERRLVERAAELLLADRCPLAELRAVRDR